MKSILIKSLLVILAGSFIFCGLSYAQDNQEKLTEEQFAQVLVRNMKLQNQLPLAPLPSDSVNLLETIGIAPLGGWKRNNFITTEDYMVIVAKSAGKEKTVYRDAVEVCQCNERTINLSWKEYYKEHGNWPTLAALMNDKEFCPAGAPKCPFDVKYEDKNNDHLVDHHYHAVAYILRDRQPPK